MREQFGSHPESPASPAVTWRLCGSGQPTRGLLGSPTCGTCGVGEDGREEIRLLLGLDGHEPHLIDETDQVSV